MTLIFSHLLAFAVLFIDSLFDLLNNNDIPDVFAVIGIIGGIIIHGFYSWQTSSIEPIMWSIGLGTFLSILGWGAYWKGLWGGADAMITSMIGFTIPTSITGVGTTYLLDFVFNFAVSALLVTVIYAGYKIREQEVELSNLVKEIKKNEKRLALEIAGSGIISALLLVQGLNGIGVFIILTALFLLFEILDNVEKNYMVQEIKKENLEGGEVPAPDQGLGNKIKGLSEEDIESIDQKTIKVRTGVPFVPVFLLSLVITDVTGLGIWLLYSIY